VRGNGIVVRVTFRTESGGMYWAVCEKVALVEYYGGYDLDSVIENSRGTGPATQITTPPEWTVMTVEEV